MVSHVTARPRLLALLMMFAACGDNQLRPDAGVAIDAPPGSSDAVSALAFAAPPVFSFPANAAPLSGRLVFETNRPSRIAIQIASPSRVFEITGEELATLHEVPILELRADTAHQITVVATDENGEQVAADPVDVMTPTVPSFAPTFQTSALIPSQLEPGVTLAAMETFVVAVDVDGEYVWFVDLGREVVDVTRLPGGTFLVLFGNRTSAAEIDGYGSVLREWAATNVKPAFSDVTPVATDSFHHELSILPDHDLLTLSTELRSYANYPTSEVDPTPRTTPVNVVGDVVVVFRPDGSVRETHSLLDVLDPYRVAYNSFGAFWSTFYQPPGSLDWSHGNAVVLDLDGGFIVSLRHQDALVKLTPAGELQWILGTHDNWPSAFSPHLLTPVGVPFSFPFHQHAPVVLPTGNILVFDNGNFRVSPPTPGAVATYSRAVEYAVDPIAKQVRQVWEFDADRSIFAAATGDVDVGASTGNVIVTFGTTGRLIEVTHTTPPVEVFRMQTSATFYRTERVRSLNP